MKQSINLIIPNLLTSNTFEASLVFININACSIILNIYQKPKKYDS